MTNFFNLSFDAAEVYHWLVSRSYIIKKSFSAHIKLFTTCIYCFVAQRFD